MASPTFSMSPVSEADIIFSNLQSVLFDSPCSWQDAESSDSGFGSSDSESETSSLERSSAKRSLFASESDDEADESPVKRRRQLVADDIKGAVEKLQATEENLVGDGSRVHSLPTVETRNHRDLKTVTAHTVQQLLQGDFSDDVSSYKIIDCRYPYEYEGGHIQGAVNIYTEEGISRLVSNAAPSPAILIFHCEFSSERGPKMMRHLRSEDRRANSHRYPELYSPEIYLMQDGYKSFFLNTDKTLCEPESYTPMLDADHTDDLKKFRSKCKSMSTGQKKMGRRRRYVARRCASSPVLSCRFDTEIETQTLVF